MSLESYFESKDSVFISFQSEMNQNVIDLIDKLKSVNSNLTFELSDENKSLENAISSIKSSKIVLVFLTSKYLQSLKNLLEFAFNIGKSMIILMIENNIDRNQFDSIDLNLAHVLNCFNEETNNWLEIHFKDIQKSINVYLKVFI